MGYRDALDFDNDKIPTEDRDFWYEDVDSCEPDSDRDYMQQNQLYYDSPEYDYTRLKLKKKVKEVYVYGEDNFWDRLGTIDYKEATQ